MRKAPIAAAVALGAAILAGTQFLGEGPGGDAPVIIEPTAPSGQGNAAGAASFGIPPDSSDAILAPAAQTARTAAPASVHLTGGAMTLRVMDSLNDHVILKYWVASAGTTDMASTPRPQLSDPTTGHLALPATSWDGLPMGSTREFLVSAPMYAPRHVSLGAPGATDTEKTITMERSTCIVGVVRDGSSAPLAAARVTLEYLSPAGAFDAQTSQPSGLPESYDGPTLRRTDDEGRYSFQRLPPGVYVTRVARDGTTHLSDPIFAEPGRWTSGDHWLDEHVRLAVTLTQASGEPAAASRVLLLNAQGPSSDGTAATTYGLPEDANVIVSRYTDDDGRATLGPLKPGLYTVYVQSDEGTVRPYDVTIREGGRSILDLALRLSPPKDHK